MKLLKGLLFKDGRLFSRCQGLSTVRWSLVEQYSFSAAYHSLLPCDHRNLVSAAVGILKHQRSKSRWSYLHSLFTSTHEGLTPSHFSQIALQIRNNPHLVLNFFQFTSNQSLCVHSLSSYATVIHILSRSRHKTKAQELIHSAIRRFPGSNIASPPPIFETLMRTYRTCDSAPFVFDLLVKACVESKRADQAVEIVRMLRSKSVYPDIRTLNSLIELVTNIQGCFAGYDFYKEIFGRIDVENWATSSNNGIKIKRPKLNTFNIMMVAFLRDGLATKVEDVWKEMVRVKCAPNIYSYSILIEAYCSDGKMDDAVRVWDAMRLDGFQHDIVAYNTMIGGFSRFGDVKKAEELFREMFVNGVESTSVTFKHLIMGYCKLGDVDSVILLYRDMSRNGFAMESTTLDAMIKVICDDQKVSEAFEIYKQVIKKHNHVFPKKESFECLIKGLCREGRMEEALTLQAEMTCTGYEPDGEMYDAFIDGYVEHGNEEMARRLREEMIRLSTPTENSLKSGPNA
ncbi:OLC1v1005276C1 [Oldenlandia corymbosa var. corymbosa]|uniref:OLC1v1005276C1 n=1 Tax=Oldenlandia corymbosa var. corymbosa TaxID=529605 RepID=A0AAV1DGA2_OLDCO|nr:OLC1v1005276C1 [Oldenlandia corymbosa var. corymbosa]